MEPLLSLTVLLSILHRPECLLDESWEPTAIECSIDSFGATCAFGMTYCSRHALKIQGSTVYFRYLAQSSVGLCRIVISLFRTWFKDRYSSPSNADAYPSRFGCVHSLYTMNLFHVFRRATTKEKAISLVSYSRTL